MMRMGLAILAVFGMTFGTAWADDDASSTISMNEIKSILEGFANTATVEKNADEMWLNATSSKGVKWYVNFFQCNPGQGKGDSPASASARCDQIQFKAHWDLGKRMDADETNRYNLKYVYGRAYLSNDGRKLYFDYPVYMRGGVNKAFLRTQVDYFLRTIDDMRNMFDL